MHDTPDPRPNAPNDGGVFVPISPAGPSGELTSPSNPALWERVEAFRDLLQRGSRLLGEVLTFTRNAEDALGAIEREKVRLDRERQALADEAARMRVEAGERAAHLTALQDELAALRARVDRASGEHLADRNALEVRLEEALARSRQLERELQHLSAKASSEAAASRLREFADLEQRTSALERELEQTRATLKSERARRDRAISLIKPSPSGPAQETLQQATP